MHRMVSANHGGDVTFSFEHVLHVISAGQITGLSTFERTMAVVRRRHVFTARQQRSNAFAEDGFAAHRDRVQGSAMKRFPHGDKLEFARGNPRQLERHADRTGAARRKEDPVEIPRCEAGQARSQFNCGPASITARAETQFIQLLFDCSDYSRMGEADLVDVVSVKIQVAPPFQILDPGALGRSQDIQAGR